MAFLIELWRFLRARKKYWLLPIILVMLLVGGLIVLAQGIEDDPENPRVVQTVRGVGYRIGPEAGAVEFSAQAGDQG